MSEPSESAAGLTTRVLEEEERRRQAQRESEQPILLPDELLPGVHGEAMSLRGGLRVGGLSLITVLLLLGAVEELDRVAIQVLGPDIQRTLGISDTLLLGLQSFGGVVLVLSTLPVRVAGRPTFPRPGARRRDRTVVGVRGDDGRSRQRVPVRHRGAGTGLRRRGPHPDRTVADRRPVPHRGADADVRVRSPRAPRRSGRRAVPRRGDRGGRREPDRRLALGAARAGRAGRPARGRDAGAPRAGPRSPGAAGRARHRGRPVARGAAGAALVGVAAPQEGALLLLPRRRHRGARLRARRRPGRVQPPAGGLLRLLGVHPWLDRLDHLGGRAHRHPDRGPVRRPAVPPRPASRCG